MPYKTAVFRKVNEGERMAHHDAVEFPDGKIVMLTFLPKGQEATVLQLPMQATAPASSDQAKTLVHAD